MAGASILTRIASGDLRAVEECIATYERVVWALARRLCSDQADAEDAVQEIFIDLWKSSPKFDPARSSEVTFVAMIARRRLIDRLRAGNRQPRTAEFTDVVSPLAGSPVIERSVEANQILRLLDELGEERKRALMLAVCHGLTHAEVAETLSMPLGTVKTHVRRGLEEIRRKLGNAFPRGQMGAAR